MDQLGRQHALSKTNPWATVAVLSRTSNKLQQACDTWKARLKHVSFNSWFFSSVKLAPMDLAFITVCKDSSLLHGLTREFYGEVVTIHNLNYIQISLLLNHNPAFAAIISGMGAIRPILARAN